MPSVKRYLSFLLLLSFLVTLVGFSAFGAFSIHTYEQQLRYSGEAVVRTYTAQFLSVLDELESFNQDIYSNDYDFQILSLGHPFADQRLQAQYNLTRIMSNRVPASGLILVCDRTGTLSFYEVGTSMQGVRNFSDNAALIDRLEEEICSLPEESLRQWRLFQSGERTVFYNAYRLQGLYLCSMIDLDAFNAAYDGLEDIDLQYAFFTTDGFITNKTFADDTGYTVDQMTRTPRVWDVFTSRYLYYATYWPDRQLGVACFLPAQDIWAYSRNAACLLGLAVLLLGLFFLGVYWGVTKLLIFPLTQISLVSHRLRDDSSAAAYTPDSNLQELRTIQESLLELANQKITLQQDVQSTQQQWEHAMLQYYQLQTRSHFFLNCLKSIFHMSENNEQKKLQLMILSFSNHLRYIFHDNLSLVPLQAEIDEVTDYYHIIQLDREAPFFLTQEVDPSLLDCMVPPLIIQTFMENANKYHGRAHSVLRFCIQIDAITLEETPFVRIRLSDNGVGFPQEMLEKLNNMDSTPEYEQYHVGISNLKRRMELIYKGNYRMAFFNGPEGGAHILLCLPLRKEISQPHEAADRG